MTSVTLKGQGRDLNILRANISKTAGDRLGSNGQLIGNNLLGFEWLRD